MLVGAAALLGEVNNGDQAWSSGDGDDGAWDMKCLHMGDNVAGRE